MVVAWFHTLTHVLGHTAPSSVSIKDRRQVGNVVQAECTPFRTFCSRCILSNVAQEVRLQGDSPRSTGPGSFGGPHPGGVVLARFSGPIDMVMHRRRAPERPADGTWHEREAFGIQ